MHSMVYTYSICKHILRYTTRALSHDTHKTHPMFLALLNRKLFVCATLLCLCAGLCARRVCISILHFIVIRQRAHRQHTRERARVHIWPHSSVHASECCCCCVQRNASSYFYSPHRLHITSHLSHRLNACACTSHTARWPHQA